MNNLIARASYKIPFFTAEKKGKYKANRVLTETQIIKAARAILKARVAQKKKNTATSPESVKELLITHMGELQNEVFICLFMDNKHQVISMEEMFHGTIDGAAIYPRVVVQRALEVNAAAVIIAHNHPSGMTEPSSADKQITIRLKEALLLVDIRLLDHFIVGGGDCISFAERGLLQSQ